MKGLKKIEAFSVEVQIRMTAIMKVLSQDGYIAEPYGKRIDAELFEIRIRHKGQYRAIYTYFWKNDVIILSAFKKKTQQTPLKEIKKAHHRLNEHLKE